MLMEALETEVEASLERHVRPARRPRARCRHTCVDSPRVAEVLPLLYLRGCPNLGCREALPVLLGPLDRGARVEALLLNERDAEFLTRPALPAPYSACVNSGL